MSHRYSSNLSVDARQEIKESQEKVVKEDTSNEKEDGLVVEDEHLEEFLENDFLLNYSLPEESVPLDYLELFYGKEYLTTAYELWNDENENIAVTVSSDTEAEMLTEEEAQEIIEEAQYAAIAGVTYSSEKLRKLDLWIKFEPALFGIFKANSVTSEVNYSAL